MIVPFDWYDFVSGLQRDLQRGISFNQRLVVFRDGLRADVRSELLVFFRQAAKASEADCAVLESPEMGESLHMVFTGDQTGKQFYAEVLAIFEQDTGRPHR